jgi:hypothetical protein
MRHAQGKHAYNILVGKPKGKTALEKYKWGSTVKMETVNNPRQCELDSSGSGQAATVDFMKIMMKMRLQRGGFFLSQELSTFQCKFFGVNLLQSI